MAVRFCLVEVGLLMFLSDPSLMKGSPGPSAKEMLFIGVVFM